jgi:hypothetical protein
MGFRGCEICKQQIDAERVANLPNTRLCKQHADEMENNKERYGGGEFISIGTVEKTTKQGGFDKGGARGVKTTLVRNVEGIEKLRDDFHSK